MQLWQRELKARQMGPCAMSSLRGTVIGFDMLVVWRDIEGRRGGCGEVRSLIIIIIIHCLTSDSDPCWAHADYSLYTCGEKTLFEKTP